MKGLIYKDFYLFFKSVDKKVIAIAGVCIAILLWKTGVYAGITASVMVSMTIGMQNIMSFANDEAANWKKYQLALPVSGRLAVASKYITVLLTAGVSILISVILNIGTGVINRRFDAQFFLLSAAASLIIPLLWTGICLPLTYWFGFRSAQMLGFLGIFPIIFLIRYFEDDPGLTSMTYSIYSYFFLAFLASIIVFSGSYGISVLGYQHQK